MSRIAISVSIVAICVVMTGCITSREFISTEKKFSERQKVTGFHIVEPGDTLFSIAWTYGWDYHELASTNSIPKPYTIYVGQKIDVSSPPEYKNTPAKASVGKSSKTVRRAETVANKASVISQNTPKNQSKAAKTTWFWPHNGPIIGRFSTRNPINKGIDIAGKLRESVNAAATGTVVYAGKGLRGYGNLVIIKHNSNFLSAYAHTSQILVREKQKVKAGQKIAEIGSTGTDTVKLHFEIRRNGRPVDPLKYLPKR